jgi:hypothetical protein
MAAPRLPRPRRVRTEIPIMPRAVSDEGSRWFFLALLCFRRPASPGQCSPVPMTGGAGTSNTQSPMPRFAAAAPTSLSNSRCHEARFLPSPSVPRLLTLSVSRMTRPCDKAQVVSYAWNAGRSTDHHPLRSGAVRFLAARLPIGDVIQDAVRQLSLVRYEHARLVRPRSPG